MSDKRRCTSRRNVLAGTALMGATAVAGGAGTHALFSDTGVESGTLTAGTWSDVNRVDFTRNGDLKSVVEGSAVTDHVPSGVNVTGSPTALLDGNYSIPFHGTTSLLTDALQYVDDAGNVSELATGATTVRTSSSILTTDSWDGSPNSVFYPNGNADTLYRVAPGESGPTEVASLSNGVTAALGAVDIDGDSTIEFAYVDGSAVVRYLKPNDTTEYKAGGVGANNNYGAGSSASFPGYGIQTPIVDGSNNVALMAGDGTKTTLTSGSPAKKTALTGRDIDEDGELEVVFVHADDKLAYVDDIGGSPTVTTLTDDTGSAVTGIDTGRGVQ